MNYRRYYQPGGRYFITVVTENRRPILIENIDRLRDAFRLCWSRYPFEVGAMVILPEHLHVLWKLPEGDSDFSKRWMVLKRKFSSGLPSVAVSLSKMKKREKGIWQRRFWEHCVRGDEDWRRIIYYIHNNPRKHGYVSFPEEWPYSSLRYGTHQGWYRTEPAGL